MGMKPRKKTAKRPHTYEELKKLSEDMGTCLVWALKYMVPMGGRDMLICRPSTGETRLWSEKFMDTLDRAGFIVDRDAYRAQKKKK